MFRSILLAIDLDDPGTTLETAGAAFRLARAEGAEIHALTVIPAMGYPMVGAQFGGDFEERARAETRARLEAWLAEHAPGDLSATAHLSQGKVYDEIIRQADALGCDAIVMGAHRPELRDYLLGPNAARVVRHARQSVLVIRPPEEVETP